MKGWWTRQTTTPGRGGGLGRPRHREGVVKPTEHRKRTEDWLVENVYHSLQKSYLAPGMPGIEMESANINIWWLPITIQDHPDVPSLCCEVLQKGRHYFLPSTIVSIKLASCVWLMQSGNWPTCFAFRPLERNFDLSISSDLHIRIRIVRIF
jgi:hypothetical protein